MAKKKTAPAPQPAVQPGIAGLEIREPTLTQQMMLDAPFGDDLAIVSARGTGKSWGIALLTARDAAHFKSNYSCLITRTTFQGLAELQQLLERYFKQVFPGTTYSNADRTFRLGGKSEPFGRVELGYTGAGPVEQVKSLNVYQGRSFLCHIADEAGNFYDFQFLDTLRATLRGPAGLPTRQILLGNPGGPLHPLLQQRFGIPAGYPEPGMASRFYSEDLGKHCIFASFTAASNQHIELDQYIRNIRVAAGDDPALLAAWLQGDLSQDIAGSFFGSSYSVKRSLRDIRPGGLQAEDLKRAFVCMDHGIAACTVAYLCLPEPTGAPKGSIWMIDEFYVAASTAAGRDWTRGAYLSNAEQAAGIIEWLARWNLDPRHTKILADDAVFNATGGPKGSTAGDFQRCRLPAASRRKDELEGGQPLGEWSERCCRRRAGIRRRHGCCGRGLVKGGWQRCRRCPAIPGMWNSLPTVWPITRSTRWLTGCSGIEANGRRASATSGFRGLEHASTSMAKPDGCSSAPAWAAIRRRQEQAQQQRKERLESLWEGYSVDDVVILGPTVTQQSYGLHLCDDAGESVLMDGVLIAIEGDYARVKIGRHQGKLARAGVQWWVSCR